MATLVGTEGDDTLVGTADGDTITGLKGADTIDGGAGADTIDGGDQADIIHGGDGNDTLNSGYETSNVVQRTTTHLEVFGDGGGNLIFGDAGDDQIRGGAKDLLDGGDGADTLVASLAPFSQPRDSGRVTLLGGAGADRITASGYYATIDGGSGDDVISITGPIVGDDPDRRHLVTLGTGADTLAMISWNQAFNTNGQIVVSDFALEDKLTYAGANGDIDPFAALADGGAGKRIGQAGADVVLLGGVTGDVVLSNVSLADLTAANFNGHAFTQTWTFGTAGADTLTGGAGVDYLDGYKGDDVLAGGGGGDQLGGGAGADLFRYFSATDSMTGGQDTLIDFETGIDRIDLTGLGATEISLVRSGNVTFVFAEAASGHFVLGVNGVADIRDLDTGALGVYAIGDNDRNVIYGGANGDVIQAGGSDDTIIGGGGGDVLFGEGGADIFRYTQASDSTAANPDGIYGFETGLDQIWLQVGATEVSLVRSGGSTFLFANTPGGALQLATVGHDLNASDIDAGGALSIYMIGDSGADTLIGGNNNDIIQGGAGDDVIIGAYGGDVLYGQGGADVFKYLAASNSAAAVGVDSIFDFQSGVDKLDLSAVRTGASDLIGVYSTGGSTFVFVDLHGDGVGDMVIQLNGTPSITGGDYLF